MITFFTHVFVQNVDSKKLLRQVGISNCSVSGDTRFDAVVAVAEKFEPIPLIEQFIATSRTIVAGSSWWADEQMLEAALAKLNNADVKLILAPHEIHEPRLNQIEKLFPYSIRISQLNPPGNGRSAKVLIIDNIGMLSRLYKYAHIAYVGGGFTPDGVHNVLEAAVYGKPVVFGRNYKKYKEAIDLVESGGATSFTTAEELHRTFRALLSDDGIYGHACRVTKDYVFRNRGATEKILSYIEENRLLTR